MSLSMYEYHGPQVPTQQEIIKDLHQQLMVKELRIKAQDKELESLRAENVKLLAFVDNVYRTRSSSLLRRLAKELLK